MHLLLRAIITGFGYKIGSELGRLFAERVGLKKPERKRSEDQSDDDMPRDLSEDAEEPPKVKVA
jgi:hypothetical protein